MPTNKYPKYKAPVDAKSLNRDPYKLYPPNSLWAPGCFFGPQAGQRTRSRLKQLWLAEFGGRMPIKRYSPYDNPYEHEDSDARFFQVFPFWWLIKVSRLPYIQDSLGHNEWLGRWEFKQQVVWRSPDFALGLIEDPDWWHENMEDSGQAWYWLQECVNETYKELGLRSVKR